MNESGVQTDEWIFRFWNAGEVVNPSKRAMKRAESGYDRQQVFDFSVLISKAQKHPEYHSRKNSNTPLRQTNRNGENFIY